MLEVLAQLGEIYLVRGANDGVRECIRRIRDCLAIYPGILAGTMPDAAAQVHDFATPRSRHMIRRYSRRAQFLQTGSGRGAGRSRGRRGRTDGALTERRRRLSRSRRRTRLPAHLRPDPVRDRAVRRRPACAVSAVVGAGARATSTASPATASPPTICWVFGGHRLRPVLRRDRPAGRGRTLAAPRRSPRPGARLGTGYAPEHNWSGRRRLVGRRPRRRPSSWCREAYPVIARYARAHDVSRCWLYLRSDPDGERCAGSRRPVLGARRTALARTGQATAHPSYPVAAQLDRTSFGAGSPRRSS